MKLSFRRIISIGLVATTVSCVHPPSEKFTAAINAGRCEEALDHVEGIKNDLRYSGPMNRAAGKVLSYSAAGAGYGADVLITVVGGSVILAALCGPMFVAAMASRSAVTGNVQCLPADVRELALPHHGKDVLAATEEMRCPDLTLVARALRKVASCHEARGDRANLENAAKTLHSMTSNREFMNCIVADERKAIDGDAYRLDLALAPEK